MKLIDTIDKYKKPFLSLEIIPPRKGTRIDKIFHTIEKLQSFHPKFISVTNHQTQFEFKERDGKITKFSKNKNAGLIGLAGAIKHRYNIETIPHLICGGINRFQIEDLLIDLQFLEIDNVFVIRGDANNGRKFEAEKDGFLYASEIVQQVADMNRGLYTFPAENLAATDFCIGAAGYPEKHYEALNLETDLKNLKKKVEAGAEYIITQMFFDFDVYKRFVENVRSTGLDVPIIPGIKPIIKEEFLKRIPRAFFVDIPARLVKLFEEAKSADEELQAGTSYMTELVEKLIDYGVPGIHLFTMGQGKSAKALLSNFKDSFQE
ncbi:MAG: methylenetetrahydrofolate reductase [Candidatus Cloacimonetes bacterium]|jgi:methylenetetrahydrofolate reductase (NADPH)|nr:methylenetetrahydrofolate reductase [Candidatus Cloacimonadota bacterium]